MEKIKVEFSHESYKEVFSQELMEKFTQEINGYLEDYKESIIAYNCYVDVIQTDQGNFRIIPICDNEDLRDTMIDLLPPLIASEK